VVAFADDDSWWAPGSLAAAATIFEQHPRVGLLHGRVLVEPGGHLDPVCLQMGAGPVEDGLPGPSIIGHLGCGAVVRRSAYLDAGGYSEVLGFGGEEALLALDLAAGGWAQCYVETLVAHHAPSTQRDDRDSRWALCRRNDTLTALMRLPRSTAALAVVGLLRQAAADRNVRRELPAFVRRLPTAIRERRPVSEEVWQQWRTVRSAAG